MNTENQDLRRNIILELTEIPEAYLLPLYNIIKTFKLEVRSIFPQSEHIEKESNKEEELYVWDEIAREAIDQRQNDKDTERMERILDILSD